MQHEQRFSDPETDEAMRLPSRKVVFVLTVVGVFMLVLAWLSSAQVTTRVPSGKLSSRNPRPSWTIIGGVRSSTSSTNPGLLMGAH